MRQQFHAAHSFHPDVKDHYRNKVRGSVSKKICRFGKGEHFITGGLEQTPERFAKRGIVINQTNYAGIDVGHASTISCSNGQSGIRP